MSERNSTAPRERQSENCKRRVPRTIGSLRLASICRLLRLRASSLFGAALVAEEERCLRGALPSIVSLSTGATSPAARVLSWAELHVPDLVQERGRGWVEALIDQPGSCRPLKADALGRLLGLTEAERSHLRAWSIGAVGTTKRQRAADRKEKDRERKRQARVAKGATPRAQSAEAVQPWLTLGISRRSFYRMTVDERKAAVSDAMALKRPQQEPSVLSTTSDETVPSRNVDGREGSLPAIPLAAIAPLALPADVWRGLGPIRRRSLEALARRTAAQAEGAAA